jgi:hypothetical protein
MPYLEYAGHQVITASDPNTASEKIATAPCDVLLLCYLMEIKTRQILAREFRERCPDGRIVAITNQHQEKPPVDADAFLYGTEAQSHYSKRCARRSRREIGSRTGFWRRSSPWARQDQSPLERFIVSLASWAAEC